MIAAMVVVIVGGFVAGASGFAILVFELRRRVRMLDERWQGRIQKCDAILASAERAEQRTHEGLVEISRCHDRMQDHLLAMERILTDPRVHQALR